jgi:hypothetical protein
MAATKIKTRSTCSESIYDKARRLVAEPERVQTIRTIGRNMWYGTVRGDHGTYEAFAIDEGFKHESGIELVGRVGCTCRAGRARRLCCHALVADEMRLRGEDE